MVAQYCQSLQAQVMRPFSLRYPNPSVKGYIIYVRINDLFRVIKLNYIK
jgi:hypothetical protein